MPREALTQNYTKNEGTMWQDFEFGDNWTAMAGSIGNDTTYFKTGSQSMIMSSTAPGVETTINRWIGAIDLRDASRQMSIWLYCHDAIPGDTIDNFYISIFDSSGTYWRFSIGGTHLLQGWNNLVITRNDWVDYGGDWSDINRIKISATAKAGQMPSLSVDSFRYGLDKSDGRIIISFDDARATIYNNGYPYMVDRGIKGTIFVVPYLIDTATYMTSANLATVYEAGWALANHGFAHVDLTTLSQAGVESDLTQCQEWLDDRGYTRASRHVAYPYGLYNDTVINGMAASGMITGRKTGVSVQDIPVGHIYILKAAQPASLGLASAKSHVDLAVDYGKTIYFYVHSIGVGDEWETADFQALMDYIVERRAKIVTVDEWYEGLTNPRYTSLTLAR